MQQRAQKMDSSRITALLFIFMLSFSTIPQTIASCNYCPKPTPPSPKSPASRTTPTPATPTPSTPIPIIGTPIALPPIKPPFTLPKMPPVTVPKLPPVTLPKMPPVNLPPYIKNPPLTLPPIGLPPILGNGPTPPPSPPPPKSSCPSPPPPPSGSCPIDALKLGACVNLLGNTVHLGDATVECCPVVDGLVGVAAAACLCTAIKANLLDINLYLPVALKVLVACGSSVPSDYTCA